MTLFPTHYTLRPYQEAAVDAAVSFLKGPATHNALEVLPTGSGKALVAANVAIRLGEPCLIFQPSKEILEQNLSKIESYGYQAAVYSASKGRQEVANITLATIGSVVGKAHLFENFRYIIVDECHLVNAKEGMYKTFFDALGDHKVLGLTATPYRLSSNSYGSELRFLTRTRPRVFKELIYYVQNRQLFDEGYLARLEYAVSNGFDRRRLEVNSTGADYTDDSVQRYYRGINFPERIVRTVEREMATRRNALVFTRFIEEARYVASWIPGSVVVTGETPKKDRERAIQSFKCGDIRTVLNVGVFSIGFDYPELETVILANATMSLARYYQWIGRAIRPHPDKDYARVVDMCGNYEMFGRIEDLEIVDGGRGKWHVENQGRVLTNVYQERRQ